MSGGAPASPVRQSPAYDHSPRTWGKESYVIPVLIAALVLFVGVPRALREILPDSFAKDVSLLDHVSPRMAVAAYARHGPPEVIRYIPTSTYVPSSGASSSQVGEAQGDDTRRTLRERMNRTDQRADHWRQLRRYDTIPCVDVHPRFNESRHRSLRMHHGQINAFKGRGI